MSATIPSARRTRATLVAGSAGKAQDDAVAFLTTVLGHTAKWRAVTDPSELRSRAANKRTLRRAAD